MVQNNSEKCELNNKDYECYRTNHFEVILTDYDNGLREVEELRLATTKAKLDKFSGDLTLYVYATRSVLEYMESLHKNHLFHVKYTLYSPDAEHNFVVLNRMMTLTEISFESYSDSCDGALVRLNFCYV